MKTANHSPPPAPSRVFDSMRILTDGAWRRIAIDQFFVLPLSVRIQHVIQRTVAFERDGREIDQKEALAELRRLRAQR